MKPSSRKHTILTIRPSNQSIRRRRDAVIQLQALLNEPDEALPVFLRRVSGDLSTDKNLTIQDAAKLLNTQPFIVQRLVDALNRFWKKDQFSLLSQADVQRITRILNSTIDVRALLLFAILDKDQDDFVTREGLTDFYENYLKGIRSFNRDRIPQYIEVLLQKFHLDDQSQIDFEEFYSILRRDPILLESLSQFTVDPTWFLSNDSSSSSQPKPNVIRRFFINLCSQQSIYGDHQSVFTVDYIRDNLPRVIFIILYIIVNLALIIYVTIYRSTVTKDHLLAVFARIGGMLLNFNCAFIIILMLKRTILVIRSSEHLRKWIPVDDHIDFHQYVGRFIAALAILHTIAHMANFGRLSAEEQNSSWAVYMRFFVQFTTRGIYGLVRGFAPLSGLILCIILGIMVICSMQWIRRGGHFQVFYWTHLLYFLFYVFLILHSTNGWKWIVGPLSLFLLEKIYSNLTRYSSRSGRTYLRSATIEQSNVISLNIHRPKHFTFKSGDYITINLPRVTLYEFHPFTISSAPEDTSYLTVHIQASGNWTKQVYQRFKDMSENKNEENHVTVYRADLDADRAAAGERKQREGIEHKESVLREISVTSTTTTASSAFARREPVVINGPYSSCARYVFDCKHVVLVGGGIGVTPYASILSSLMAQFRASRTICRHCQHVNYNPRGLVENRRLKKVDFIWINRDHKNFEWFLNLLRQFEEEQDSYLESNPDEHRFLDIHLYFTEIKNEKNIGNVPLDLITKIWAQIAGHDIFTSLKSKTHIGRPPWDDIFNSLISGENASIANDVSVFFCGPTAMGTTIRRHCREFQFRYYEEKF